MITCFMGGPRYLKKKMLWNEYDGKTKCTIISVDMGIATHIDDRTNNSFNNIEWISYREIFGYYYPKNGFSSVKSLRAIIELRE